jgi:hypothetical protein
MRVCVASFFYATLWLVRSSSNVPTANEEVSTQQMSEAGTHEQLVTGYAEYRASLSQRKNYHQAEDIDLCQGGCQSSGRCEACE